jgi:hypothetical protein
VADIPFVGPSYQLTSRPASVQRTINMIPVPQEPGNERTAWVFKDAPGLVLIQDFAEGEPDVLVIAFLRATDRNFNAGTLTGANFTTARPLTESDYAEHMGAGKIRISDTGTYEVTVNYVFESTKMETDAVKVATDIAADAYSLAFEVYASGAREINIGGDAIPFVDEGRICQTTQFVLNVYQAPVEFYPQMFALAEAAEPTFSADMVVVVRRSGDSIYTPP